MQPKFTSTPWLLLCSGSGSGIRLSFLSLVTLWFFIPVVWLDFSDKARFLGWLRAAFTSGSMTEGGVVREEPNQKRREAWLWWYLQGEREWRMRRKMHRLRLSPLIIVICHLSTDFLLRNHSISMLVVWFGWTGFVRISAYPAPSHQ